MKKVFFATIAITICFGSYAMAKNAKTAETKNEVEKIAVERTDNMVHELNLTENQKQAVMKVNLFVATQQKPDAATNEKINRIRDERYKNILNAEQYQKYTETKLKNKDELKENRIDNRVSK